MHPSCTNSPYVVTALHRYRLWCEVTVGEPEPYPAADRQVKEWLIDELGNKKPSGSRTPLILNHKSIVYSFHKVMSVNGVTVAKGVGFYQPFFLLAYFRLF